jgi:5-methylcytosine-specific restriction endonuclease McrA
MPVVIRAGERPRCKIIREGEKFRVRDIYERDGWKCGICHKKVNKKLSYPNPMSASLDHIIAIALGGEHAKVNVQLAHLVCNRNAKTGGIKQLRLVG